MKFKIYRTKIISNDIIEDGAKIILWETKYNNDFTLTCVNHPWIGTIKKTNITDMPLMSKGISYIRCIVEIGYGNLKSEVEEFIPETVGYDYDLSSPLVLAERIMQ